MDYKWVILSLGFTVLFFSSGTRFAFGLLLLPMSNELGLSRASLSSAATIFFVVSALLMPVVGRLADRYSVRWVLASAAVVAGVSIGLLKIVELQWQLVLLFGIVYAAGNAGTSITPVSVMTSRWFQRGRGIATSAAVSGTAVGQLVIIATLASTLAYLGWRNAFLALGVANLVIVLPLVLAFGRYQPGDEGQPDGPDNEATVEQASPLVPAPMPMSAIFRARQFWLLLAIYGICGFQDFFMATHIVAFALDLGVGVVAAGTVFALMSLMGLAGVLAAGLLSDAFGAARPTIMCFAIRIAIFAMVVFFKQTPTVVAFALLYGFTFLITAPLTVIFARNMFGAARIGTVSGLITMVHQVAGGGGALMGGLVFDRWGGYDYALVVLFALAIAAAALSLLIRDRRVAGAAHAVP